MKSVNIQRGKLLEIVMKNATDHSKEVDEAMAGYRKQLLDYSERWTSAIRSDISHGTLTRDSLNRERDGLTVPEEPESHVKEYTAVIRALELSSDDVIELDDQDFQCFVLDQWHWKDSYLRRNSTYSTAVASKLNNDRY